MKLAIHMKSGKTLIVKNVRDWTINYDNDSIVKFSVEYSRWRNKNKGLIIGSLILQQIEAIEKI